MTAGLDGETRLGDCRPPQCPFDERAPDGEVLQFLVGIGHDAAELRPGVDLRRARTEQSLVHVGKMAAQLAAATWDEAVWLQELRDPGARPFRRALRRITGPEVVAFDERHPVTVPGEQERRRQAGDASSHHDGGVHSDDYPRIRALLPGPAGTIGGRSAIDRMPGWAWQTYGTAFTGRLAV